MISSSLSLALLPLQLYITGLPYISGYSVYVLLRVWFIGKKFFFEKHNALDSSRNEIPVLKLLVFYAYNCFHDLVV